jgi:hypothetical protein
MPHHAGMSILSLMMKITDSIRSYRSQIEFLTINLGLEHQCVTLQRTSGIAQNVRKNGKSLVG